MGVAFQCRLTLKGVAVDGAIEHPRTDDAMSGESGYAGCRFPVAMRDAGPQAFAAPAATIVRAMLVDAQAS